MMPLIFIDLHASDDGLHLESAGRKIKIALDDILMLGAMDELTQNRQKGQPVICVIKDEALQLLQRQKPLEEKPTKREIEIGRLLANGYSAARVGKELFISKETVSWHRKNLYRKLGIEKINQLRAAMIRNNLM